jgi:cation diffusion facilitator family transporter
MASEHPHHGPGGEHPHRGGGGEHPHRGPSGALTGLRHRAAHLIVPHSHDVADQLDAALEASSAGTRTLLWSLVGLLFTALVQGLVVLASGSVSLLGDTAHNLADAFTAVPLLAAFALARRPTSNRFPHGLGRVEDLAGVVVVLAITASAAFAAAEAVSRLAHPQRVTHLLLVSGAALVGFAGNEIVARYRIGTGRRIGSAALVADGLHARTDGFTSLAVLIGAGGVALGWGAADPIVGLLITVAILVVLVGALRQVGGRLLDAVEPALMAQLRAELAQVPGVRGVGRVRARWVGHQLHADGEIAVDPTLSVAAGHAIAEEARHRLLHAHERLSEVRLHVDPADVGAADVGAADVGAPLAADAHALLADHDAGRRHRHDADE